jgi:hypothetical protein
MRSLTGFVLAALIAVICSEAWAQDAKAPLKQLTSGQKSSARDAIVGEGKVQEAGLAKVREVGPLSKAAVEDFLKKFAFPFAAQKPGVGKRDLSFKGATRDYTLYVPKTYNPAKAVPLIISLHGAGGTGDGDFKWIWSSDSQNWNGLIACPSGQPAGEQWFKQEEFVFAVLADIRSKFNVDTNCVYITGFSNGGNGAWHFATVYPGLFAAACPRGGGNRWPFEMLGNLRDLGIYLIHGENDTTIPSKDDAENAAKLKEMGFDIVYAQVAGGKHDPYVRENPKVIEYFNKHKRNPWVKKITFVALEGPPTNVYWITVAKPSGELRVEADVQEGNKIAVTVSGTPEVCLHLSDALVDLDKPVVVTLNGTEVHNGPVERKLETLVTDLREWRDVNSAGCVKLAFEVK